MKYSVNPAAWGAVFAVPAQVVDKHIRLAGAVQLKVLLWLFRHSADNSEIEQMVSDIGISRPDIEDAIQYWVEAGIICVDGKITEVKAEKETEEIKTEPQKKPEKVLSDIPYTKPNMEQIIARCNESPEIRFMFSEIQNKLGKTIGHDGQSTLLMMHDHYGLPVEVILMIVEYCTSIGKSAFSYIARIGKDWGEKEIDTIEKADEMISYLQNSNALWNQLRQMAGLSTPKPTSAQVKYLNTWSTEYGFDIEMIYIAYEEMANNCAKISFPYMNTILSNWHKSGVKTPDDVEKMKESRQNKKTDKKSSETTASYDIDKFTQSAMNKPLVYQKKEDKK